MSACNDSFDSFQLAVSQLSDMTLLSGMCFIRGIFNAYVYAGDFGWGVDELAEMEDCLQDEILLRFDRMVRSAGNSVSDCSGE